MIRDCIVLHQMNQWILSQGGFIGSFDVLWSMWSRITGPGPDHPNRTHSRPLLCFSPKTFDTGIKPQMPNKRKMKGGGGEKTESKSPWGNVTFLSKSYYETFPFVHSCKQHFRQSGFFSRWWLEKGMKLLGRMGQLLFTQALNKNASCMMQQSWSML